MTNFYKNYVGLCAQKNVSLSAAAEAVGLSRTGPNGWKKGKKPSDLSLQKLANYFGVSVEELTGEKKMSAQDRIKLILSKRNIPVIYMEAKLDFEPGYIDSLDGNIPEEDLAKIAEYLSCTPEFLLHGYQERPAAGSEALTVEEIKAAFRGRSIPELMEILTAITEEIKNSNGK